MIDSLPIVALPHHSHAKTRHRVSARKVLTVLFGYFINCELPYVLKSIRYHFTSFTTQRSLLKKDIFYSFFTKM